MCKMQTMHKDMSDEKLNKKPFENKKTLSIYTIDFT